MIRRLSLIVFTLLFLCGQVYGADQFYLSWDPNTETDLSHYVAYYCDPGMGIDLTDPAACSKMQNHGKWTPNTEIVSGRIRTTIQAPKDGQVFFLTAVDKSDNESGESNRVKWIAQAPPPVEPPPPGDTTPPAPPKGLQIIRVEVSVGITIRK